MLKTIKEELEMSNCGSCPSKGECNKDQQSCGIQNNPLNKIKKIINYRLGNTNLEG